LASVIVGDANEAVTEGKDGAIEVGKAREVKGGGGVGVAVGEEEAVGEVKEEKGGGVTVVERDEGWLGDERVP